ncbi:hypothetical protein ONS96_008691 [Cadophora gregata f. sp. sojae]|nr:hypothetical protein ONS96_008691 [Cadophora gregata f. sp. sojae]
MQTSLIAATIALLACVSAWEMPPLGQRDPSLCVAPAEYEACNKDAWAKVDNYMNGKKRDTSEYVDCFCFSNAYLLNCEAQFCWNKVYGCEYNDIAENLLSFCSPDLVKSDGIPFWPAPGNAPGACSCDNSATDLEMADIWSTTREACSTGEVTDPNDKNSAANCGCCYWSISFLSTIESCPKYDFPYFRYDDERKANLSNFDKTWLSCQDTLPTADCKALGYSYTREVYLPSALPLPGTETMSNLPGQVTAPVSGWTFTWSAARFNYAVTAFSPTGTIINVPASTDSSSSSGGISGSASSGTITSSPIAATSASSSSATTSTSWGQKAMDGNLVLKGAVACVLFQVILGFSV